MPSDRGGTAVGSFRGTRSSPSAPAPFWISTPAAGTGRPLGPHDYVLSADEKTSIQARARCHPSAPVAPGHVQRVEHEYERRGAWAYLAAWDVHRARLFGRCAPAPGSPPSIVSSTT